MFLAPALPRETCASSISPSSKLGPLLRAEALADDEVARERLVSACSLLQNSGIKRLASEWEWITFVMLDRSHQQAFIASYQSSPGTENDNSRTFDFASMSDDTLYAHRWELFTLSGLVGTPRLAEAFALLKRHRIDWADDRDIGMRDVAVFAHMDEENQEVFAKRFAEGRAGGSRRGGAPFLDLSLYRCVQSPVKAAVETCGQATDQSDDEYGTAVIMNVPAAPARVYYMDRPRGSETSARPVAPSRPSLASAHSTTTTTNTNNNNNNNNRPVTANTRTSAHEPSVTPYRSQSQSLQPRPDAHITKEKSSVLTTTTASQPPQTPTANPRPLRLSANIDFSKNRKRRVALVLAVVMLLLAILVFAAFGVVSLSS